jgi:hypothetical protein
MIISIDRDRIIEIRNYSGFVASSISPHPNPSPKQGEGLKYSRVLQLLSLGRSDQNRVLDGFS